MLRVVRKFVCRCGIATFACIFILNYNPIITILRSEINAEMSENEMTVFDDINISVPSDKLQVILEATLFRGHFGYKARYKLFPNSFLAEKRYNLAKDPICVAMQSSLDRISSIKQYLKNWPGSVSLAVFAPAYQFYFAVVLIKHLRKCHSNIKNQVTWHLVYPKLLPPSLNSIKILHSEFNCSASDSSIMSHLKTLLSSTQDPIPNNLLYPQNTLRNLARQHCKNEWVMSPDIDMLFPDNSEHLISTRLNDFLRGSAAVKCHKCAFVFPLYQVNNFQNKVPTSKKVLLQYLAKKKAQVFHVDYAPQNQGSSDLGAWEKLPMSDEISIAAEINYNWLYEPVYLAKQGTPSFDERYIGYGMTRNTQALEMHLEEYKFYLLDTIFLCHFWNSSQINSQEETEASKFRNRQNVYNSKIFHKFHLRELSIRYDVDLTTMVTTYVEDFMAVGVHRNTINDTFREESYKQLIKFLIDKYPGTLGF